MQSACIQLFIIKYKHESFNHDTHADMHTLYYTSHLLYIMVSLAPSIVKLCIILFINVSVSQNTKCKFIYIQEN